MASDGCILVTHDVHTMPKHFSDFLLGGGTSPGVLLVRQRVPIPNVAEALILIWSASDAIEWEAGQFKSSHSY